MLCYYCVTRVFELIGINSNSGGWTPDLKHWSTTVTTNWIFDLPPDCGVIHVDDVVSDVVTCVADDGVETSDTGGAKVGLGLEADFVEETWWMVLPAVCACDVPFEAATSADIRWVEAGCTARYEGVNSSNDVRGGADLVSVEAVVEPGAGSARMYVGGPVLCMCFYWAIHFDATVDAPECISASVDCVVGSGALCELTSTDLGYDPGKNICYLSEAI